MPVKILEATIRDGSYEVGFHFTLEDVAVLCGTLDRAGFSFIEVGHGNGLGGDVLEPAAASDEDYLAVARRAVKQAKLGAVVAFTKREEQVLDKLRLAADSGLDFIRLALVPRRSNDPIVGSCVRLAKKLGLTLSINYMRTYCADPEEVAERSKGLLDLGADWLYVVDSAGGMVPGQVKEYVEALCSTGASAVGFHGHNNTQLAVANSLAAMEAGAVLLDASLQGLGRATGNTPTEILLAILQARYAEEMGIDRQLLCAVGQRYIRPLLQAGFDSTHVWAGVYNLHSSFLPHLEAFARSTRVPIEDLLPEVARRGVRAGGLEQKTFPDEFVAEVCEELRQRAARADDPTDLNPGELAAVSASDGANTARGLLAALKTCSLRDHLRVALVLVPEALWPFGHPAIFCREGWAFGVAPVAEDAHAAWQDFSTPGFLDVLFVAHELRPGLDGCPAIEVGRMFRLADVLAEAAVLGIEDTSAPTLVAVEDPSLRAAVLGRMGGYPHDVLSASDAPDEGRRVGTYRHVLGQGAGLDRLWRERTFIESLSAATTITMFGRDPIPAGSIAALRRSRCRIRLPDPIPLLLARTIVRDELHLVDGPAAATRELLDSSASLVVVGADVIDGATARHLGELPQFKSVVRGSEAHYASRIASSVRLSRLLR